MAASSGSLTKLSIQAFSNAAFTDRVGLPLAVQINPARYSQALKICFTNDDAIGGTGKAMVYHRSDGETLDLDLVFDGTGAVGDGEGKTVEQRLRDFRDVTVRINGEIHEPNYLILSWGKLRFRGRLKSLSVDYTLFNPDGTPLRAKVKAGFVGFQENREARVEANYRSPDLTRLVTVRQGDTLPLLCHHIYGDSRYYSKVAEYNGLDDFRRLMPGAELVFPPLRSAGA